MHSDIFKKMNLTKLLKNVFEDFKYLKAYHIIYFTIDDNRKKH